MSDIQTKTLEVLRKNISDMRFSSASISLDLGANEVLFEVDQLSLTANNISYAKSGDQLGYWDFFPTSSGWGRIPGIGWATVVKSSHPQITEGARTWGFYPYASHHKILAGNVVATGFSDASTHRSGHAPVYTKFDLASSFPVYDEARESQDSLLRGLYATSWLLEDFFQTNSYFESALCIVTSASSKTGIALAHSLQKRGFSCVGLTSAANVAFCERTGCYDKAMSYEDFASLDNTKAVIMADFTGNTSLISKLHHHFGDNMKFSSRIGATHPSGLHRPGEMPGARPTFFFAPTHSERLNSTLGVEHVTKILFGAYKEFRVFCDGWLKIEHSESEVDLVRAYLSALNGTVPPDTGQIVSLTA